MVLPLGQKRDPGAIAPQFIHLISSSGYRPLLKLLTNKTTRALSLLAKQSTKMCNAIYQNHLGLDYLLASEGGVCEKFNLSNCCLQTDYKGKVIKKIRQNEEDCQSPHPDLEKMESQ
jgi:hypothetical protein